MSTQALRTTDKCVVYWDYYSMPIPKESNLSTIVPQLKHKLWSCIGAKLPIQFKVYIRASNITQEIQNAFDINGIMQIQIPSNKPESVDKRMMLDITFSLFELERDNKTRPIALISADEDFGHLLSKIHHTPPISNQFLILLRNTSIDSNLSNAVDQIIQLDHAYEYDHKYPIKHIQDKSHENKKSLKRISINVQELNSNITTTISVDRDAKINKIKHKIRVSLIPSFKGREVDNSLILSFKGREVWNRKYLTDYGISNGDTLVWFWAQNGNVNVTKALKAKQKKKKVDIVQIRFEHLYNLDSKTFILEIKTKNSTVGNVREMVHQKNIQFGLAKKSLLLLFNGNELKDDIKITDLNLSHNDTIRWHYEMNMIDAPNMSETEFESKCTIAANMIVIELQQQVTKKKITISIGKGTKIKKIKKHIRKCAVSGVTTNVNGAPIYIQFNGQILGNVNTLESYGICNGDTLVWYWSKNENVKVTKAKQKKKKIDVVQIRFEHLNSSHKTFILDIKTKDNIVSNVREMVHQKNIQLSLAKKSLLLLFDGNELKDNTKITDLNLSHNDTILWHYEMNMIHVQNNENKMQINDTELMSDPHNISQTEPANMIAIELQQQLTNKKITITIYKGTKIKTLKKQIRKCCVQIISIGSADINIQSNGQILANENTLESYGICNGDTLLWRWKAETVIVIELQQQSTNMSMAISVDTELSYIKSIRKLIRKNYEISDEKEITLQFESTALENKQKICAYGIRDGDALIWKAEKKRKKAAEKICIKLKQCNSDNIFTIKWKRSAPINNIRDVVYCNNKHLIKQRNQIILHHEEVELIDNKLISDYDICDGDTIIWFTDCSDKIQSESCGNDNNSTKAAVGIQQQEDESGNVPDGQINASADDEKVMIVIKSELNETLSFNMNRDYWICDLKYKIHERLAIDPIDQILKFKNRELNVLQDFNGFENGDIIELDVRNKINIDIEIQNNEILRALSFWNNTQVIICKSQLVGKCGIKVKQQMLLYNGMEMQDDFALWNYGIIDGSLLTLTVKTE